MVSILGLFSIGSISGEIKKPGFVIVDNYAEISGYGSTAKAEYHGTLPPAVRLAINNFVAAEKSSARPYDSTVDAMYQRAKEVTEKDPTLTPFEKQTMFGPEGYITQNYEHVRQEWARSVHAESHERKKPRVVEDFPSD